MAWRAESWQCVSQVAPLSQDTPTAACAPSWDEPYHWTCLVHQCWDVFLPLHSQFHQDLPEANPLINSPNRTARLTLYMWIMVPKAWAVIATNTCHGHIPPALSSRMAAIGLVYFSCLALTCQCLEQPPLDRTPGQVGLALSRVPRPSGGRPGAAQQQGHRQPWI